MDNPERENHLLIVQVEPPQKGHGGDYFYRTHAPGRAMAAQDGVFVINLTNVHRKKREVMSRADILILNDTCDPDLLPLIHERKRRGKLTVYEIGDDFCDIQPWSPVYFFYKNRENVALLQRLAGCCDAIQVSVPELKKLYNCLNPTCVVFPNHILKIPRKRKVRSYDRVVVGWGGSHGHLKDVEEIAEPLMDWVLSKSHVLLSLMCSDPMWQLFDRLPKQKKKHTPPGSINDYYDFLTEIDIGIAPIRDTPFNRSRSDIKFLEYAVSRVVPVVTSLEPYINTVKNGETGFLFGDSTELINILDGLSENISLMDEVSNAARRYVMEERLQMKHGRERVDFYRRELMGLSGAKGMTSDCIQSVAAWSELDGAVRKGNHIRLDATRFENLLHDGLVMMQINKDRQGAHLLFQEAAAIEPENYLPFLFGASASPDPISSLQKSVELNPDSMKARILLGEEYVKKGKIKESMESFESVLKVYPEYEVPYLRAAGLLKRLGMQPEADRLASKAVELLQPCPFTEDFHPSV